MTSNTSAKDASDAKRWLIIGAHQAGASEKRVARISGLSKTAVRHIILNYQRTGNPCLPKREPKKVKDKLLVEYDENGNLILSDDDEDNTPMPSKKENATINKVQPNGKKKRSSKLNSKVTAKDLIEYMMKQVKRVEDEYSPLPTSTANQPQQQQQHYHDDRDQQQSYYESPHSHDEYQQHYHHHRSTWCPTPPRDGSISSTNSGPSDSESPLIINKKPTNHLPLPDSPSFLPLSPPASGSSKSTTTDHDPPHPHDNTHQQQNPSRQSPTSSLPSPSKYDQTIRGYELWTHKDDMLLLQHVLCRLQLGNWRELEAKFEGRHTARLCIARWNYLRDHLLKGIARADTSPW